MDCAIKEEGDGETEIHKRGERWQELSGADHLRKSESVGSK